MTGWLQPLPSGFSGTGFQSGRSLALQDLSCLEVFSGRGAVVNGFRSKGRLANLGLPAVSFYGARLVRASCL